jgi:tetratricopeptide (TPR) repeat protein
MKKAQITLVSLAVVIIALLYIYGNRVGPLKKVAKDEHSHQDGQSAKMPGADIPTITLADIENRANSALSPEEKNKLSKLPKANKSADLEAISKFWASVKQPNMSAKYKADIAKLVNTEKSLTFASQYFIALFNNEEDLSTKKWQALQAIELLEKAQTLNPSSEDIKTALGMCYTDGTGETMKGVLLLREIATSNPNNITAGNKLGALAIQSGQFDKAIDRLEKLVALYPNNTEVLYNLAEAYKGKGNTEKAKTLFNQCKKLINKPEFSKEIDAYIKTF